MIASVFSKTRPFNYLVIGILSLLFFVFKFISIEKPATDWIFYVGQVGLFVLIFSSLAILNWIFIIICIGAMAYWLKQLKIFKDNNDDTQDTTAHSFLK